MREPCSLVLKYHCLNSEFVFRRMTCVLSSVFTLNMFFLPNGITNNGTPSVLNRLFLPNGITNDRTPQCALMLERHLVQLSVITDY